MGNDEYLVSICIPTYNRREYLKKCIESIVSQKAFHEGIVEICVSDNNSDDGTEELCIDYSHKYRNFSFVKHNETMVPEYNHAYAVGMGKGKLLKLSNDTLIYTPDSLEKMCAISEKYNESKPFVFFVNGNPECKGAYGSDDYINGTAKHYRFEDFLYNISYWTTFLGSFAFWNEDFKVYNPKIEGYETSLRHVFFVCDILKDRDDAMIVSDVLFDNQPVSGKNVSYGLFRVFYSNYLKILSNYIETDCFDFLKRDVLTRFFPIWVVRWEFNKGDLRFSEEENLKGLVVQACKENDCYNEYYVAYKKLKKDFVHADIKRKIRKLIPWKK